MSNSEKSKKAAEIGNNVAEFLIDPTGGDADIALESLFRASLIIIEAVGINPVDYFQKLSEGVQNAIDGKEL